MRYLGDGPGHTMLRGLLRLEESAAEILSEKDFERFLEMRAKQTLDYNDHSGGDDNSANGSVSVDDIAVPGEDNAGIELPAVFEMHNEDTDYEGESDTESEDEDQEEEGGKNSEDYNNEELDEDGSDEERELERDGDEY